MKALYPTPRICIRLPYETPSMNSCRKWSSRTVCCLLSILCRNARYTPCQMEKPCSDWIICVYNRLKNTLPLCNSGRACKALIFFVLLTSPITFLSSIKTTCRMYPAGFFYFIRYADRISLLSLLCLSQESIPHFHYQHNLILIRCIPHNVHVRRDIIFMIFLQPC